MTTKKIGGNVTRESTETCVHMYDDAFDVDAKKWGTFTSYDSEGHAIITSLTEEECVNATRWYLKQKQEGFPEVGSSYDSTVGGKL